MRISNISYLALKYNTTSFGSKKPKDERRFLKMRDEIERDISRFETRRNLADWEFTVNSTEENKRTLQRENRRISNYYNNSTGLFRELKEIDKRGLIKDPKLIRQLDYLIALFSTSVRNKKDKNELEKIVTDILRKRNSYQFAVDGNPTTEAEIYHRELSETDPQVREKLYKAKIKVGDVIADDIIELIKKRNDCARREGYDNYFDYEYSQYSDFSSENLNQWLDEVYKNIRSQNIAYCEEENQKLADFFGISADKIREYHRSYFLKNSYQRRISREILSVEQILDICSSAYSGMGFDITRMPILIDYLPRKNKDTGNFCSNITPGKDVRLCLNLTNDFGDILTLIHELGHAIYDLNTDKKLPNMDKQPNAVLTEGFAMMMEDVVFAENLTSGISDIKLSKELKKYRITEIMRDLMRIEFEKSLYQNPYQDPKALWHKLSVKYHSTGRNDKPDNYWATINHFTESPAYHAIYFLSELFKVQLYNALTAKFGPITQNSDTANYLKRHFFRYGSSLPDNKLIINVTGKELSPQDFIQSVK